MDQKTVIRWSFFNLIFPVKIAVLKSLFIIFTKRANPKSDPLKIEMKKNATYQSRIGTYIL